MQKSELAEHQEREAERRKIAGNNEQVLMERGENEAAVTPSPMRERLQSMSRGKLLEQTAAPPTRRSAPSWPPAAAALSPALRAGWPLQGIRSELAILSEQKRLVADENARLKIERVDDINESEVERLRKSAARRWCAARGDCLR